VTVTKRAVPWTLPAAGIALAVGFGLAHWANDPDPTVHLPFGAFLMGALWLFFEWVTARSESDRPEAALEIRNFQRTVFMVAALYTAVFSALKFAADAGLLTESLRIAAIRGMGTSFGLLMAIWGNFLPKLLSPWRRSEEPFDWQGVHRTVGWLVSLAGLTIAIAWLALPLAPAWTLSKIVFIGVGVLAVGVKFYSVATHPGDRVARP
jgi:hypothetical protein